MNSGASAMNDPAVVAVVLFFATVILLGLVLFLLWLRLALETRLVLWGIILAVFSVWCGLASGTVSVAGSNRPEVALGFRGDLGGGILKLGAVLILGGI